MDEDWIENSLFALRRGSGPGRKLKVRAYPGERATLRWVDPVQQAEGTNGVRGDMRVQQEPSALIMTNL